MRKGFTLIELLAVIVILAIILVIAIPQINKVISDASISAYKSDESMLVKASETYISLNSNILPKNIGETITIDLSDLKDSGLINNIKDPKNTNIECDGHILIKMKSDKSLDYIPYLKCGNNYVTQDIIKDGLVLDMPLGDYMSGNTYLDKSGYSNNGTNSGSILTQNRFNKENKASYFDGADDYVNIASSTSLNNFADMTISFWINWTGLYGEDIIINKESCFEMASIGGYLQYATKPWEWRGTSVVNTNTWYYAAYTHDGDGLQKIYINGIEVYSNTSGGNIPNGSLVTTLGARGAGTLNYYKGSIDDVKMYNRYLTSDEIKHNYDIESNYSE